MRKIKKIATSVLLASLAIIFTSCDDGSSVEYYGKDKISFSWWGNDKRHEYTMEGIDCFEELYPDIDVSCRYAEWNGYENRYKVRTESNTQEDVMQINYAWLDKYSEDGNGYYNLYELQDYIDLSSYSEEDLSYGVVDGKLNAVPIAFNTSTIFFDQNLLDKYDIDVPETWDDYFAAAKILSKDGIYVLGMGKKQVFFLCVAHYEQTTGKNVFSEDGDLIISRADMSEIISFYKMLIDEMVVMPIDEFGLNKFSSGECAGTVIWVSDSGNYCGELEKNGGKPVISDYPVEPGAKKTGWYIKPATMYAISKDTEHPEESAKLLNYLVNSKEMALLQKTEKGVPTSQKAYTYLEENGDLNSYETIATEKMEDYKSNLDTIIPSLENDDILTLFKTECDKYLYGKITLDECTDNVYSGIRDILKK